MELSVIGIYHGKQDVRVEERDKPQIGLKYALLKVLAGGICGTDINIIKYGSEMGIRLGQEFAGIEFVSVHTKNRNCLK